jgi:hypothetical protein
MFVKGMKQYPGAGRKKGSGLKGKLGLAALDVIAKVGDDLGGRHGLLKWVKADPKNKAEFWKSIYPKILPLQVSGNGGGPLQVTLLPQDATL